MERRIDHDEEDRDSSEYEEIDDDDEEEQPKLAPPPVFQQEYLEEQQPGHLEMNEIPVAMNIEYEEVYPHNAVEQHVVEAEKVYYENEMEDLVYHEIYGEGGSDQKLGGDKRIRNIVGTVASCIVCLRSESEKIRLFKWPKNQELREQWLHFFRLPESVINSVNEPYICCYHFSADTFVMMEDRIFWKMTALPKYRQRRPGLADPFPWEASIKAKEEQLIGTSSTDSLASMGYKIRYRMPFNKHKSRNVHQVAVMTPVAHPHLYYEFHFNRYGLNQTRFYACLNCRKAKTESGIRDVIRTIHLDGNKFLSNGDPFNGHHFACRPHNIYDFKSSYRSAASQNPEFLDEVVYLDEQGDPVEWENVTREDTTTSEVRKEDVEIYQQFDGEPICEEVIETNFQVEPQLEAPYPLQQESIRGKNKGKQPRIRCHICKMHVSSTKCFIQHLQKHVANEKTCQRCKKKISCDTHPFFIRRGFCESCTSTS